MSTLRKTTFVALLLGSLVLAPAGFATEVGQPPHDQVGTVDGEAVRLSDQPGKVRVVTFWASWCPPCRKELPVLAQIQSKVGTDQLQVYAINYMESERTFRKLSRQLGDASDMLFLHDADGAVGAAYGVQGIPFMVILDREGNVAYLHRGYVDSVLDQLIDELNTLLAAPG